MSCGESDVEPYLRIFPMMMNPAGTLKPVQVFVIGAGVAVFQAYCYAKRLGAAVIAYEQTREVVCGKSKCALLELKF